MKKINNVCIVDDDPITQFLTHKVIQQTDLVNHVKIFSNGLDTINYLSSVHDNFEELPDVILLDLFMPIMDGWGFMKEYLSLQPKLTKKIAIYIVSSSIDPADIRRAESIDAITDFIIKPVTKEKLMEAMKIHDDYQDEKHILKTS